jgi:chorismate-pyruvate lyase
VAPPLLSRTYRVLVGGVAALIITELFDIERQRAGYGLRSPADAVLAA